MSGSEFIGLLSSIAGLIGAVVSTIGYFRAREKNRENALPVDEPAIQIPQAIPIVTTQSETSNESLREPPEKDVQNQLFLARHIRNGLHKSQSVFGGGFEGVKNVKLTSGGVFQPTGFFKSSSDENAIQALSNLIREAKAGQVRVDPRVKQYIDLLISEASHRLKNMSQLPFWTTMGAIAVFLVSLGGGLLIKGPFFGFLFFISLCLGGFAVSSYVVWFIHRKICRDILYYLQNT